MRTNGRYHSFKEFIIESPGYIMLTIQSEMYVRYSCKIIDGRFGEKERLIINTRRLMESDKLDFYPELVDYNRQLFNELYDLDIFLFINTGLVDKFCKKHKRCKEWLL